VTLPNIITISGHLTADPQFFQTRSGRPKVAFRLACPRPSGRTGPTLMDFVTIVCVGQRFLPLLETLRQGHLVTVVGQLQSRDLPDGRSATEIRAHTVLPTAELAGGRQDSDSHVRT